MDSFWTPKDLGHFWTTFSDSIGLWIGHDLEKFQIFHHYYVCTCCRPVLPYPCLFHACYISMPVNLPCLLAGVHITYHACRDAMPSARSRLSALPELSYCATILPPMPMLLLERRQQANFWWKESVSSRRHITRYGMSEKSHSRPATEEAVLAAGHTAILVTAAAGHTAILVTAAAGHTAAGYSCCWSQLLPDTQLLVTAAAGHSCCRTHSCWLQLLLVIAAGYSCWLQMLVAAAGCRCQTPDCWLHRCQLVDQRGINLALWFLPI